MFPKFQKDQYLTSSYWNMLDMHHELQRIPQFQQFLLQLVINLKLFEAVSAGDPPQTWLFPGNYVGSEVWVTLASHRCHPHAGPDPIHLSPTGLSHQIINVLMSMLFILSLLDIFSESWKIQKVYLVLLQKQITIMFIIFWFWVEIYEGAH